MQKSIIPDPESDLSSDNGPDKLTITEAAVIALVFTFAYPAIIWHGVKHWWQYRRVCAWCIPRRRMSGAPWARHETTGICRSCQAIRDAEYEEFMQGRHSNVTTDTKPI